MAEKVFALFETVTDARRAMRMLMDAEIGFEEVTICSTEPILDREFLPPENRKTRLPLFAMAGGVLGAAAGYLLPSLTARMMNLPTGGQPIVSLWAFGVVIFELAALGAIGGTVIALLREAGLPRLKGKLYDDECRHDLADGGWLIGVTADHPERMEEVRRVLQEAGAKKIKAV